MDADAPHDLGLVRDDGEPVQLDDAVVGIVIEV